MPTLQKTPPSHNDCEGGQSESGFPELKDEQDDDAARLFYPVYSIACLFDSENIATSTLNTLRELADHAEII